MGYRTDYIIGAFVASLMLYLCGVQEQNALPLYIYPQHLSNKTDSFKLTAHSQTTTYANINMDIDIDEAIC